MPNLVGTEVARTRSRVAVAHRSGDPEKITIARRDHAAARLAAFIERTVADAPELTPEQADELVGLLRATPTAGGGHRAS